MRQSTLEQSGYKIGVANPRTLDFVVVGSRRALDRMGKTLSGKCSMREPHRLRFGNHCERHAELLNRTVSVGTDSDGKRYVRIEPDIRHAELVLRDLGVEGCMRKPLTTPGLKLDEREFALRETEVPLEATDALRYKSCIMFSQDRADLGEPVKCLARSMAKPTPGSLREFKKVARYLLRTKYMALHLLVSSNFSKQHLDLR